MARARDRKTLRQAAKMLDRQAEELALRSPVTASMVASVEEVELAPSAEDREQHDQCKHLARRLRTMARR